jgi:VWFA-related protein
MRSRLVILGRLVLLAIVVPGSQTGAQSPTEPIPTLKEFGSSLSRLKWDPVKQAAVETGSTEKRPVNAEDVIRIDIELVVCDVLILDEQGRAVRGLTRDDFIVAEDGQPQQISHFSLGSEGEVERSIVLIIDYSGSQLPYIRNSVEAAKTLVDKLGPKDRMAIVTDDVDLKVNYTRDKAKLKDALEDLRQRAMLQERYGRSEQFTALMATARELFSSEDFRRIVIFQTDGDELTLLQPTDFYRYLDIPPPAADASAKEKRKSEELISKIISQFKIKPVIKEFGLNDVYKAAEKSRATVYSVIPGVRFIGLAPVEQLEGMKKSMDDWALVRRDSVDYRSLSTKVLAKIEKQLLKGAEMWASRQSAVSGVAKTTGGFTSFLENPNQAEEIYTRILSDMNSRYVIGYYPKNKTRDGKRRKVLIEVRNRPEYTVEGRKTYFAPGPEQ